MVLSGWERQEGKRVWRPVKEAAAKLRTGHLRPLVAATSSERCITETRAQKGRVPGPIQARHGNNFNGSVCNQTLSRERVLGKIGDSS